MAGRLVKLMLVCAVAGLLALGAGYWRLVSWGDKRIDIKGDRVVEVKPGTSLASLADQLEDQGVVSSALLFHLYVKMEGNYPRYQAGRYRFTGKVAPADVAGEIIKGETYNPIVLQITVPEGFTSRQVAERLAANGVGHIVEITHLMHDPTFLASLHVPSTSIEGYLYPATYNFTEMPSPVTALTEMVKTFWQNLPKDYEKHVNAMGLTLNQAVTFASLIELETRQSDEKPLISEVIWRRLKDKTPLAIDAALIYGIPDYDGKIHTANLTDASNLYNTRIHGGLPPTPIGSPGVKSLEAVLTPSNFGYYYYVLIPGEARHHFSKTLQEHNEHVKTLVNGTKHMTKGRGRR